MVYSGAIFAGDMREIWMAYTGTSAAWGSGVGFSRITGAAVLKG